MGRMKTTERDRRAYQVVGNDLIRRIREGEFRVVGRLPPERDLADAYEVGRTVIRDALVMLEVKGLIEPRQGSGVYITRKAYKVEPIEPIDMPLASSRDALPPAGPFELLQARQWLESHIARLAALNMTDDDLASIQSAYDDHSQAQSDGAKESLDIQFHMSIARATQNPELAALVEQLWHRRDNNPMWRNLHRRIKDSQYRERWVHDHGRIVDAMRRRDGEAAYVAMWNHIENVKSFLLDSSDTDTGKDMAKLTLPASRQPRLNA